MLCVVMCRQCGIPVYHTVYTSPTCWIKTPHIITSRITLHRLNSLNSKDFNHYPVLTYTHITYTILTEITIFNYYVVTSTQLTTVDKKNQLDVTFCIPLFLF